MKLITALIQPEKFQEIHAELEAFGVSGMTVTEASGYGKQRGHVEVYRGQEFTVSLLPKVRLEIVTTEQRAQDIVEIIIAAANTGSPGDGKIWISTVDEVIRIRTGERGSAAL
ncbi:P-II family nitrogen regulator [Rothia terrae]|uniref:P-II family nitrogen regulator n=1 Tax=Rothia terrae TaxID=396015 RepID=A0A7H2BG32_9MICC|nr:P-II family nitrogen regulator [Rothia terrae]MDT0188978.1 P-II family nitrogen regulator [Rothia terrae]QNV38628.1 P-II family nitrogen regulator [Rothia terrae]